MKKRLFSAVSVFCAAALCTVLFAACGGGEEPGDQPGVPVTYTIAAEPSEDYTLTPSKTSAEAGEVTLAAATGTYAEKLTGDFISFTGFLPDTIAAFENTFDAEAAFEFTFDREIQVEDDEVMLASSNQSIVPDSALSVSLNETSLGSTGKDGGTLYVAVNDIAPGTAYITMTVKDRTTGRSDTVVKKLTEDSSEITVTMENFAVGHTYSVGVQFMNGEDHYAFAKMNSLTNSKGSFDGSWLKLEEAEAVDFGTLTAYSVG